MWEGFLLEEVLKSDPSPLKQSFFWCTHAGAEVDLLVKQENEFTGFEFKHADASPITLSMPLGITDLRFYRLNLIYPGNVDDVLSSHIHVYGFRSYLKPTQQKF